MTIDLERIVVTRRVRATPEHVYGFFTDPALWVRWQGSDAQLEARPGGLLRIVMAPATNGVAEGRFVELDPFVRIVFTWGWVGSPLSSLPPGSTTVTVDFEPDGDGTLVRLTHEALPPPERPAHETGWEIYLDRLVQVAEGGTAGREPRAPNAPDRP